MPQAAAQQDASCEGGRVGLAGTETERVGLWLLACWLTITTAWWMLALAPVANPPSWLEAARSVCFGSTASGLPDTYGWLLLAAAPGTMLIAILVTWQHELRAAVAALSRSTRGRVGMTLVAVLLAAGVSAASLRIAAGLAVENASFAPADVGALPGNYPRLGTAVPKLALVDQDGRHFSGDDLRGRVTLFTFAHCHTMCPAIVQTLRSVAERLGGDGPEIVLLTLDPWRDTPSRLSQMHDEWKMPKHVHVLSGDVGDVTAALDGFNVPWKRDEATGDVVHPALVYAIDAEGRIAYAFNNPSVDWLVEAASRLGRETGNVASKR